MELKEQIYQQKLKLTELDSENAIKKEDIWIIENDQDVKEKRETIENLETELEKLIEENIDQSSDLDQVKLEYDYATEEILKKRIKILQGQSTYNFDPSSYLGTLERNKENEVKVLEDLQTKFYNETVKMSTFGEDEDNILFFIQEFVAKITGKNKKSNEDYRSFKKLSKEDQDNINDLLVKYSINYS